MGVLLETRGSGESLPAFPTGVNSRACVLSPENFSRFVIELRRLDVRTFKKLLDFSQVWILIDDFLPKMPLKGCNVSEGSSALSTRIFLSVCAASTSRMMMSGIFFR